MLSKEHVVDENLLTFMSVGQRFLSVFAFSLFFTRGLQKRSSKNRHEQRTFRKLSVYQLDHATCERTFYDVHERVS
jgi:hypothetical protein